MATELHQPFQLCIDNIPSIAWLADINGVILEANEAFINFHKLMKHDVIGKTFYDILPPQNADKFHTQHQQAVQSQQALTLEINCETKLSGQTEVIWIESTLLPIYTDKDRQEMRIFGFGHDITGKKQTAIAQQEKLNIYFQLPLIGMAVISADQQWLEINQKLCDMLGYSYDQLIQINLAQLICDKYKATMQAAFDQLSKQQVDSLDLDIEMYHKNGNKLCIRLTAQSPLTKSELDTGFVIMLEDTTVRKHAAQKLQLADKVIESSSEAILITDHNNTIIRINPAFTQLTGYQEHEVLGRDPSLLKSGRQSKEFYQLLWHNLLDKGHWQGEIWDRRKNGTTYPKWMHISKISDTEEDGIGKYVAIFSDITEQKQAENKIRYMVYHDSLTELPNRSLFEERLNRAINDAEVEVENCQIGVMLMDLDHFKNFNDSMGHYIGDQLLVEVSKRLKTIFRTTDLIARFGGDEFVIMLDKVKCRDNLKKLANKVLDAFQQPFNVLEYTLHISPSIGITQYPDDGANYEILLQNADTAMFNSKKAGRNQFTFFAQEMNKAAQQRLRLEYQMRLAIEQKSFKLFYQPQIDLEQNKITGVEALIRWPHKGSMISPAEFIPVAEDTGLIRTLGKWILETACIDCKSWHDLGFPISVAVNLSAQQFETDYLIASINDAIKLSGFNPDYLDLEITESALMINSNSAITLLNKLKEMGIKLSIDDFGTGYSSLAYLKAFNIDKLKIDQSFVFNLPDDKDDAAITSAIIQMAKSLNLKIVAEGAETLESVEFLRQHGCEQVQGYYYAKPMPAHELITFMQAWV